MRISKDLTEYCFDLYSGYMAIKINDKKQQDVQGEFPKHVKTESKE